MGMQEDICTPTFLRNIMPWQARINTTTISNITQRLPRLQHCTTPMRLAIRPHMAKQREVMHTFEQ